MLRIVLAIEPTPNPFCPDALQSNAIAGGCAPAARGWHGAPGFGALQFPGLVICVVSKAIGSAMNVSTAKSCLIPLAFKHAATWIAPEVLLPPKARGTNVSMSARWEQFGLARRLLATACTCDLASSVKARPSCQPLPSGPAFGFSETARS